MLLTGLQVCLENILTAPSPPREVYVDTTQRHQTTLNKHFKKFHKVRLIETKSLACLPDYAVLSGQWF